MSTPASQFPAAQTDRTPLRFVTAASLFDGHDAAINIMRRLIQGEGAEVIHLGHTSHASPLKVEFHKGVGLARYFRKRARGLGQQAVALLLSPVIVCTAVIRPMLWRLRGRAA